jgi:hypothetical protein
MTVKTSWDQAYIRQKLGLVWRNRKKISQIIKDYFCLPFFLLIILLYERKTQLDNMSCRIILNKYIQCPNYLNPLLYVIRNALARVDQGLEEEGGSPRRWTPGQLISNLVNAFMSMVNTARSNIRRWNET